jgi:hypothetical protein
MKREMIGNPLLQEDNQTMTRTAKSSIAFERDDARPTCFKKLLVAAWQNHHLRGRSRNGCFRGLEKGCGRRGFERARTRGRPVSVAQRSDLHDFKFQLQAFTESLMPQALRPLPNWSPA